MKRPLLTFVIFLTTQLLYWLIALRENIIAGEEVSFVTALIGIPIALSFWAFRWVRWVASILLLLAALVTGSLTFDGYSVSFMAIAFLYILVIYLILSHTPSNTDVTKEKTESDSSGKPIVNGFYANNTAYHYPLLVKRYQSLLIDFFLWFTVMIIAMVLLGKSDFRQEVLITLATLFLFVYEPVLTAFNATIGQRIMGIRVRDAENPEHRIGLLNAYARSLIKFLLGWLSFLTISFDRKHRAIHDFAGSSVVIIKKSE